MDIRFSKRLGIGLFLLFTVLAAWLALDRVDRLARSAADLRNQPFALADALLEAHDRAFQAQTALHTAVVTPDSAQSAAALQAVDRHVAALRGSLATIASRFREDADRMAPLMASLADWNEMRYEVADLLAAGQAETAHELMSTRGEAIFRRQHHAMAELLELERELATALRGDAEAAERNASVASLILAVLAGGALMSTVLGYAVFIRTHRPLMRLRGALLALANGQHDAAVPHRDQPGVIGSLARAIQRFKDSLAERDAAMAALRLADDRLKAALSIAPVAVFNLDRDLRYTWIYNCQVPAPPEEFPGRTGADFFEAEGYAKRERLFRRVLATGQNASDEIVLRLKGQIEDRHFYQMVAPRWSGDGAIIGLTCAAIDITEQVRAKETQMAALEEARRANDAKARFLSAASHDLRQPLQALRLYLDLLDGRLTEAGDRKVLVGALAALAAGEELLRNYLDVSLLESGLVTPELTDFPIQEVFADLTAECRAAAADKGLAFRLVPSAALVRSDPRLLRNLLRNLLVNALRYTREGAVLLGCRRVGATLRIEVWDTGIGIPGDQLNSVFEDFYQIGNRERDRTKGLGLGLSVVDRAARLLGHEVRATSRLGRGSVFAVTVPLAQGCQLKRDAA